MTDSPNSQDPSPRPATVVVLGGTGFVGRALCRKLSAGGRWHVVATTRTVSHGAAIAGLPGVRIEPLDPRDESALSAALERADAVVNLVAILHGDARRFHDVHVKLPEALAQAVRRLPGRRLVHVSAIGVDSPGDSQYLQSKAWGERLMRDLCPQATSLRPSVIFGKEDRFINTFARLQRFAPAVPLACSDARFQPVWVEDVAAAVQACLERPETSGQAFECAGPDVLTLAEIVRRAGRWAGVPRPVLPLPLPLAKAQAWVMERLPGEPLMSRDNLRSMQTPSVATPGAPGLRDLGIVARSLDDYLGLE